jgi:hypothetical protein
MAGLSGTSSWTHLLPGFIIAGLGSGMVNPPLASTAIGVVPPHQAGMASGTNATFRQVGIATGIAGLGSVFASAMQSHLASTLPPSLAGSAGTIASAVRQGSVGHVLASLPTADRGSTALALRSSFASGLNDLLYIAAALALAGGGVRGAADPEQGLRQAGWRRTEDCQRAGFRGTGLGSEVTGGTPAAIRCSARQSGGGRRPAQLRRTG